MLRSGLVERFFLEGEEQESSGYKNVALETDARRDAGRYDFDSFDKVPRRKRPLLIVAGFSMILGVALAAWSMDLPTKRVLRGDVAVPSALPGPAQTHGVASGAKATLPQPVADKGPYPRAAGVRNPTARPAHSRNRRNNATDSASVGVPSPARSAVTVGIDVSVPKRGYVWSPKTKTLVPVDDLAPTEAEISDSALTDAPAKRMDVEPIEPEFVPAVMEAVPIGSAGPTHEPPPILD